MFRKTLTILSLIGLLLSVGAWIVAWRTSATYFASCGQVGIGNGCVLFGWYGECMDGPLGWNIEEAQLRYWWIQKTHFGGGGPFFYLPLWMPALFFTSILSISYCLPLHRRSKRKKLGLCVTCGYDLRGSVGPCPECGTTTSEVRAKLERCSKPTNPESREIFIPFYAELDLLTSDVDRRVVLKAAYARLHRSRPFRIYLLLWVVVIFPPISVITLALTIMIANLEWLIAGAGVVAMAGSLFLSYDVLFRKRVQMHLRDEMVARGVSLCLQCGYDLRGSVERCPECGKEFS